MSTVVDDCCMMHPTILLMCRNEIEEARNVLRDSPDALAMVLDYNSLVFVEARCPDLLQDCKLYVHLMCSTQLII